MSDFPFTENGNVRVFKSTVNELELVWHWDEQDRIVKSANQTNWMIQLDNKLPESINTEVTIPAGMFHRLIKGTNDLTIIINTK